MNEQDNEVSSLQQHLEGGSVTAIESALKLKATVGFPYSSYKYYDFDWDSEEEYNEFIEFGSTSASISGRVYNKGTETGYDTTIILYNGSYYVQVEVDWEYGGGTVFNTENFPDYLAALRYAYGVVFNH
jgi:hypothetical protein